MSLSVNLRHVEDHEVHLKGELPVETLNFELHDDLIRARQPLRYDLQVETLHDALLVQGKLELTLDCECARCLKPFQTRLHLDHWALHLPLEGEEKVAVDNDTVDLTPFVREDILLEFPQHPLCNTECVGLEKISEKTRDKRENKSAWVELNKLKL